MQKIAVFSGKNTGPEIGIKTPIRRVLSCRVVSGSVPAAPPLVADPASVPASKLAALVDDYLDDYAIARHSAASLSNKRVRLGNRHGS